MNRTWHQRQAHRARREQQRAKVYGLDALYHYWRGKYNAHCEAMTAIDREASQKQRKARAARRKKAK